MNREEFDRWWDDATPRERDAAVAREVLSLEEWCDCGTGLTSGDQVCGLCMKGWLPPATQYIEDAWGVVRWVEAHDRVWWQLEQTSSGYCFGICADGKSALAGARADGVTEAEAICKATLLSARGIR